MDEYLKVKVSRMYYLMDLNKKEIARRLGISRFRVSRILEQARQEGIVRIQIVEPVDTHSEIEEQLEKRFDLHQAIVVSPASQTDQAIKEAIGRATAKHLVNLLSDGDVLGMTWGTTINEVVKALPTRVDVKLQVVQITGGLNQVAIDVNAMDLARRVAEVCNATSYVLYAPAMVSSQAAREALLADNGIRQTCDMFDSVTVVLTGIGALSSDHLSTFVRAGYVTAEELEYLRRKQTVGEVAAHFVDIQGRITDGGLEQRLLGMSVAQLRKVRYIIGVAGGVDKSLAILGALRGRLINVLVTDRTTAEEVLAKDRIL